MKLTTSLFFLPVAGVFGSGTGAELHLAANSLIAQPALGTIQGSVKDENGSPIRGATVLYRRITPVPRSGIAPAGDVAVHRLIDSDDNGALIAPNLPVGDYAICVSVRGAAYLDPCQWGGSKRMTVSAGATAQQAIVLRKGVFLKIRVDDPNGVLPAVQEGPSVPTRLILGVMFGNGAFLPAANARIDKSGRDYQMVIPAGVPLKLWAFSRHVTLTDSTGVPLDKLGAKTPFQTTAGQDYQFTLKVSGRVANPQ